MGLVRDHLEQLAVRERYWPLLILGSIPAALPLIQQYFSITFREAVNHWSLWVFSGVVLTVSGVTTYLLEFFPRRRQPRRRSIYDRPRGWSLAYRNSKRFWIALTVVALGVFSATTGIRAYFRASTSGAVDFDITLYEGIGEFPGRQPPFPGTQYPRPPDTTLTYVYERHGNTVFVEYEMPYLKLLSTGGPISALPVANDHFAWQYPRLAVKVVNNTARTVFLTEAAIDVTASKIDTEPILMIKSGEALTGYMYNGALYEVGLGTFHLINEGWGDVVNAIVDYQARAYEPNVINFSQAGSVQLGTFSDRAEVTITRSFVPPMLNAEQECVFADVSGQIRYKTRDDQLRTVKFLTKIRLRDCGHANGPSIPNSLYSTMLEAGKERYVRSVPIAQELGPGQTDNFLLQLGSDKSAHFDLNLSLREASGLSIQAKPVSIDVFVPRSAWAYEVELEQSPNFQKEKRMKAIPKETK